MRCECFLAKGSAESHSQARQAQRRRAVWHRTRGRAGWRYAYPAYGVLHRLIPPRPGKRSAAGQDTANTVAVFMQDGATLIRPTGSSHRLIPPRPGQRSATGQDIRLDTRHVAGWRLRLTRPGGFVRPVLDLPTCATETAGADGLKIAETFPEGRGSPHGCGLRAVFCTDAASARPEACRDKSKGPRSGDFAGRSPGVQGAAATGRPLCAPCAVRDITQTINRERKFH